MSKDKIPKTIKDAVWNEYNGREATEKLCYAGCGRFVHIQDYVCGHVNSEYHGGKVEVSNLRPICSKCNSSMGTQNMLEFAKKYGNEKAPIICEENGKIKQKEYDGEIKQQLEIIKKDDSLIKFINEIIDDKMQNVELSPHKYNDDYDSEETEEMLESDDENTIINNINVSDGNKYVCKISDKELVVFMPFDELCEEYSIRPWMHNRDLKNKKVNDLYEYHSKFYQKFGHIDYIGEFVSCLVNTNNQCYVIDGQHRYKALQRLQLDGYKLPIIQLRMLIINSEDDIFDRFKLINKVDPIENWLIDPERNNDKFKNTINNVMYNLQQTYPKIFKNNKRVKRPYIKEDEFKNNLLNQCFNMFKQYNLNSCDKILAHFNKFNTIWINYDFYKDTIGLKKYIIKHLPYEPKEQVEIDVIEHAKHLNCMLGIFGSHKEGVNNMIECINDSSKL